MKLITISFMFLMLMFSVNATEIYLGDSSSLPTIPDDFTNQIYKHEQTVLGNESLEIDVLRNIIFSESEKTLITVQTLNTDNETHEYKLFANSLTGGLTFNSQNFSLVQDEQRILGVFSTISDEEVDIYLKCLDCDETVDPYSVTYQLLEEEPQTINTAFSPLIEGVVTLVEINVTGWRMVFYTISLGIMLLGLFGLFWFSFRMLKFNKKLQNKGEDETRF